MNGFARNMLGATAAACLLTAPAAADVLDVLTRSTSTDSTDNAKTQLPLNDAGDTSFTYQADNLVEVFTFNAECTAAGLAGSFVKINITVDNHPTDPQSGKDSAFCSPTGNLVSASRMTTHKFTGHRLHTIRVYATGVGTTSWRLNSSLLQIDQ